MFKTDVPVSKLQLFLTQPVELFWLFPTHPCIMIKNDLIDELHRNIGGINRKDIAEYVDTFFEMLSESLDEGDNVKITNFGTFEVKHKNARIGRNPVTMKEYEISARRVVSFHASDVLKKRLNSCEADQAIKARNKAIQELQNEEEP